MTDDDRLHFALRFATMDLTALRPGDWLNLREDLRAFVALPAGASESLPPLQGVKTSGPDPATMTPDEVSDLQAQLRPCLLPPPGTTGLVGPGALFEFTSRPQFGLTDSAVVVRASTRDVFFMQLLAAVLRRAPVHVRGCPECQTLFHTRKDDQVYCTRLCGNRAGVRRFRARVAATSGTKPVTIKL